MTFPSLKPIKLAIASPSFCKNQDLINEISRLDLDIKINTNRVILTGQSLCDFIDDSEIAIIGTEAITSDVLGHCSQLKLIAKYGVGLDQIDQVACRHYCVDIGWTPGVNKRSVAEMTLGFMITLSQNMIQTSKALTNGIWNKVGGRLLSGKTIGIIGLGQIGKQVVTLLTPFNCRILANDIAIDSHFCKSHNVTITDKETLFRESNIISLHVPLTLETTHLINAHTLSLMNTSTILINTSRGSVVDLSALRDALDERRLFAAGLDVYSTEPLQDNSLPASPHVFCTPHIGGAALESVLAMGRSAISHVRAYVNQCK